MWTPYVYAMVGRLEVRQYTATVGPTSRSSMSSLAPVEDFHRSATMKSGISLPTYSQKSVMMSRWNLIQPLTGETLAHRTANISDGARLDVSKRRHSWMSGCSTLMLRQTKTLALQTVTKSTKMKKKRAYEQRVRDVEHSTFTPIVLSATGGMAKQSTTFYKRLASRLAEKWEQTYCSTLYWLRARLSFSLLRSAIQCIRGARSSRGHAVKSSPIDLISSEASLHS